MHALILQWVCQIYNRLSEVRPEAMGPTLALVLRGLGYTPDQLWRISEEINKQAAKMREGK